VAMTAVRVAISSAASAGLIYFIPGTWSVVHMNRLSALFEGGVVGVTTFGLFGSFLAALWLFAGKPPGAEKRAIQILLERVPSLRLRSFRLR
jgi:hypothetical protein